MVHAISPRVVRVCGAVLLGIWLPGRAALAAPVPPAIEPLEKFSPSFLGIYRKMMLIEDQIVRYSAVHGVDPRLAKAVCMYESGGNANLESVAGAQGYFQVMPRTFRLMGVETNIEAGIKYLGRMYRQLGREDYALAAYNGGPGRVAGGRPMPLESLQYVVGVGGYHEVLGSFEASVRAHAGSLEVTRVEAGEDWWALERRLGVPVVQLRLHNPFLAARPLRAGFLVSYPRVPRTDVFTGSDGVVRFRIKLGDNYMKVAYALGLDLEQVRQVNGLWRLRQPLPGTEILIPPDSGASFATYTVQPGDTLPAIAAPLRADPWSIVKDNALWTGEPSPGTVLRIRKGAPPAVRLAAAPVRRAGAKGPAVGRHRVRVGDTLGALARRYGTNVTALQTLNGLGRRTAIRAGQLLRVPR